MKRWLSVGISFCVIVASLASAQSVDDVVAKHLEARGGADNIRAVETARVSGTMTMGGQMEAPFVWTWKRPNMLRLEFTFQGMTAIQAFDGESGWSLVPFQGETDPQIVSEDEANILEEQADFDGPFIDSEDKGYTIELIGEEEIEGTPAHKLKVTNKHGDVSYVFLDGDYFLEIKSEGKRTVRGQEIEFETSQGDYKEVDGLMFAHSIESRPSGAPAGRVLTFEKIELNVDVPDSEFVMPEPEESEEPEDVEEG